MGGYCFLYFRDFFPKIEGLVGEDEEASYGKDYSHFGEAFNALKHPHRAGHLLRTLGLPICYKKAYILSVRLSFL